MTTQTQEVSTYGKVHAAELFKKLGLTVADERPIMQGWREANAAWRQERRQRIAAYAQRAEKHRRRYLQARLARSEAGRARAVWCVELQRCFPSLCAAARFVNRKASNISQAISRGGWCGRYHWEAYDPRNHCDG